MPQFARGYCNRCGSERDILLTVPWQDDVCRDCGSKDVDLDS